MAEKINVQEELKKLNVSKKIAIVLSQYPTISYKVMSHFNNDDQQEILKELAKPKTIPQAVVDAVIDEFLDFYVNNAVALQGGMDVVRDILVNLYGEDGANERLSQIAASLDGSPLQSLKKVDTESLINFVRGAHPQIIATLLCYLNDNKKSAAVLSSIDKDVQKQVVTGMAAMEKGRIAEDMIDALQDYVEKTFSSSMYSKGRSNKIGGIDSVVVVMNSVDMSTEKYIMDALEDENPELAEEIKKKMFIFDDFIKLADRDIQLVLREVTNDDQLAMCLKYCDEKIREELQEKFLKNMSKRKADNVRETMSITTRVKKKDLEEARQAITSVAKKLHEKGEIAIGNSNDEYAE